MTINVFSPSFDPCDSYGRVASELSDWVEREGRQRVNRFAPDVPPGQFIEPVFGGFILGYPTKSHGAFSSMGVRVAITMFEATKLPAGWVDALNEMHRVIVPSEFCRDVFEREGVRTPIHVVPLGVTEAFKAPRTRRYDPERTVFKVLVIGDRGRRKGWWEAMLAFHRAFGNDGHFRLIVKSRSAPLRVKNPNVQFITRDMTKYELRDLFYSAHVMLFPGREGFGLPPREFAATGGVAMALDWGGTADDIRRWGVQLPVRGTETAFPNHPDFAGGVGEWGKVDVSETAETLRLVHTYYEHYAAGAMRAATYVARKYQWRIFAQECLQIYQDAMETRYARLSG